MLFLSNKYTKWYFKIIESAKAFQPASYIEKHHIIPKCFGGSDDQDNIVKLSAKQHYVCHLLLTKMVSTKRRRWQMVTALEYMANVRNGVTKDRYNSRSFEYHKKYVSKVKSEIFSGPGNPRYGAIVSEDTKRLISEARKGVDTNTPENNEKKRQIWKSQLNPNNDPILKAKAAHNRSRTYRLTTPDGNVLIVKNLKQWCKEHNMHNGNLYRNHVKGWKCEKLN